MHLDSAKLLVVGLLPRLTARMLSTHPRIGHADDPGVAADHQEDEAEQRHVPSAKEQTRAGRKKMPNAIKKSFLFVFLWPSCSPVLGAATGGLEYSLGQKKMSNEKEKHPGFN